jgi:hypothetical protein
MDVELALFVIQPSSLVTKGLVARTGDVINAMCTAESVELHCQLCRKQPRAKSGQPLKFSGRTCVFVDQLSRPSSAMW